jgi:hypothetical protein
MPIDNTLAAQIGGSSSGQKDPFRSVLEYSQIGEISHRNSLLDAQTGEARARAGEAGTASARNVAETGQITALTKPKVDVENARANSLRAETEKARVTTSAARADNGARLGNAILSGGTPDEVNELAQSYGEPPIPPQQLQQYKDNPALFASHGRNLVAFGLTGAQGTAPHTLQPGGGYTTTTQGLRNSVPQAQPQQPGQPPIPGQPATQAPGMAPMSPAQKAESAGLGADAAKDYEASAKSYNGALELKGRLAVINHNIDTLGPQWMGAGADAKAEIGKAWNSTLDTLGVEGFHVNPDKIATWEDFNKETTRAGMELIKSNFGGSREAASIIQMGRTAVPSVQNTYLGAKYVSSTISAAAQRQIDLHEFKTDLVNNGKSLIGADAAFNKAHPAEDYARGAIAGVIPKISVDKLLAGGPTETFDSHYGPGMAQYILSHRPQ